MQGAVVVVVVVNRVGRADGPQEAGGRRSGTESLLSQYGGGRVC